MSAIIDKVLLFPYYLTLKTRHFLYDRGILKTYKPEILSVCIGNITVGGTGKTPMTELLIRMFSGEMRIAVISRGYGRKSKGLRTVEATDSYLDTGDEPLQIKRKFPEIDVIVDNSRKRAIRYLSELAEDRRPQLILLDDAFQHRKVKAAYNIVLVSSTRPIFNDSLLPIGRLRDLPSRICEADMVVVTKTDHEPSPTEKAQWRDKLHLRKKTPLFFSRTVYEHPMPVFPETGDNRYLYSKKAVLFSGIADSSNLKREVGCEYELCEKLSFSDHHDYSESDIRRIASAARRYQTAVILTTEKDAQRLFLRKDIPQSVKTRLFYLPIATEIIPSNLPERYIEEEVGKFGERELKSTIINNTAWQVS